MGNTKNIISGYEDGTFRPRNNVSEAEWLAMMAKYYKEDIKSEGKVSRTHWANQIYKVMEKHKLPVKGTSNSKARDIATKRKELAQIVAASHGFNMSYEQAIEYMYENEFSSGNNPSKKTYETYGAEENLQRQQAVMFLMKIDSKVKERGGVVFRGKFYPVENGKIVGIPDGGIKIEEPKKEEPIVKPPVEEGFVDMLKMKEKNGFKFPAYMMGVPEGKKKLELAINMHFSNTPEDIERTVKYIDDNLKGVVEEKHLDDLKRIIKEGRRTGASYNVDYKSNGRNFGFTRLGSSMVVVTLE